MERKGSEHPGTQKPPRTVAVFGHRRIQNFVLRPNLQVRLGIYFSGLTLLFAIAVMAILYFNLRSLVEMLIQLTGLEDEVRDLIQSYLGGTKWWLAGAALVYFLINLLVSILFTHKLIGPAIAFRRHVRRLRRGEYSSRVVLRRGDAFQEVAEELNLLAEMLAEKDSGRRDETP